MALWLRSSRGPRLVADAPPSDPSSRLEVGDRADVFLSSLGSLRSSGVSVLEMPDLFARRPENITYPESYETSFRNDSDPFEEDLSPAARTAARRGDDFRPSEFGGS